MSFIATPIATIRNQLDNFVSRVLTQAHRAYLELINSENPWPSSNPNPKPNADPNPSRNPSSEKGCSFPPVDTIGVHSVAQYFQQHRRYSRGFPKKKGDYQSGPDCSNSDETEESDGIEFKSRDSNYLDNKVHKSKFKFLTDRQFEVRIAAVHIRRGDLLVKTEKGEPRYPERRTFPIEAYLSKIPPTAQVVIWTTDDLSILPPYVNLLEIDAFLDSEHRSMRLGPNNRIHITIMRQSNDLLHSPYKGAGVKPTETLLKTTGKSRRLTRATLEDMWLLRSSDAIIGTIQSSFDSAAALIKHARVLDQARACSYEPWDSAFDRNANILGFDMYISNPPYPVHITGEDLLHHVEGTRDMPVVSDQWCHNRGLTHQVYTDAMRNIWLDIDCVTNGTCVHGAIHSGTMQGASQIKDPLVRWYLISARFQESPLSQEQMSHLLNPSNAKGHHNDYHTPTSSKSPNSGPIPPNICTPDPVTGMPFVALDVFDYHVSYADWRGRRSADSESTSFICPEHVLPKTHRNVKDYLELGTHLLAFWKDSAGLSCVVAVAKMIETSFPEPEHRPKKMQEFLRLAQETMDQDSVETVLTNQWIVKDADVKDYLIQRGVLRTQ
eukprot:CAMPEP_0184497790 /NCGR_PEP_ID=MMETSP0113_2-20130426/37437_1 /TAXON_ID=91329 /ORGANISM="Norrisiella sphaerica, Strain BC52" /LENGTH=608 /DNA_ID=CAMNT_0026885041 /DNA_START=583 /DNA_END=2409 /DNA_ORIENTATION=-